MQSVSKSWVIPLGQVTYSECYSSEPQPKANKQITPSNLSETISALPNLRIQSKELITIFHEQKRAQLFNSRVWKIFLVNCGIGDRVQEETEVLLHTSRCILSICTLTKVKPPRTENHIYLHQQRSGPGLILVGVSSP